MNKIQEFHNDQKEVSARQLFACQESVVVLHIRAGGLLKEHITKTEALLVCISGGVIFENELQESFTLTEGGYLKIPPFVKHWVKGVTDSHLLLIK